MINKFKFLENIFNFIEKNKINYDLNKTHATVDSINDLVFDTNLDRKKISIANNFNFATIFKNLEKNKININDELSFMFKNYKNSSNSNLYNKIKNNIFQKKTNYVNNINYKVFKEYYSKIKKPISYKFLKNNKIKENNKLNITFTSFSNNIYNKKINEYIRNRGGQKYTNNNKIKKNNEKISIFFGDK
jgi:hypothetical protein